MSLEVVHGMVLGLGGQGCRYKSCRIVSGHFISVSVERVCYLNRRNGDESAERGVHVLSASQREVSMILEKGRQPTTLGANAEEPNGTQP